MSITSWSCCSSETSSIAHNPNRPDPAVQERQNKVEAAFKKVQEGDKLTTEELGFLSEISLPEDRMRNPFQTRFVQQIGKLVQEIKAPQPPLAPLSRQLDDNFQAMRESGDRHVVDQNIRALARAVFELAQAIPCDPMKMITAFQRQYPLPSERRLVHWFRQWIIPYALPDKTKANQPITALQFKSNVPIPSSSSMRLPDDPEEQWPTYPKREGTTAHNEARKTAFVRYDQRGVPELVHEAMGLADFSCTQVLTQDKKKEMIALYKTMARPPYNNLGGLLEFAAHVRSVRAQHPTQSLNEAWDSYHQDLSTLFHKYQSGTCLSLATVFCQQLAKQGVDAMPVATLNLNAWLRLPIPGTENYPQKLLALSQLLQGADHTSVLVFFRDAEHRKKHVILFACTLQEEVFEIEEFPKCSIERGLSGFFGKDEFKRGTNFLNRIIDPSLLAKRWLKGRFRSIFKAQNGAKLVVDLLEGTLRWHPYRQDFSSQSHPPLFDIPLNSLAHPENKSQLQQILACAKQEGLTIPDTMEEDLMTLAQIAPEFLHSFLLDPLPLVQRHHKTLRSIAQEIQKMRDSRSPDRLIIDQHVAVCEALANNESDKIDELLLCLLLAQAARNIVHVSDLSA